MGVPRGVPDQKGQTEKGQIETCQSRVSEQFYERCARSTDALTHVARLSL
jgi:hypothetical protein